MADAEAVVLSGGFSTRFGDDDKATASLDGSPLISHVVGTVSEVEGLETVIVNTRPGQTSEVRDCLRSDPRSEDAEIFFAEDEKPGLGPVGGVFTGMGKANSEYVVVVACDMPLLSPQLLEFLLEEARRFEADAVVPRLDGWLQTTHAVYKREPTLEACKRSLSDGDGDEVSMRRTLEALNYVSLDEEDVLEHASKDSFVNINTADDLERVEEILS